MFERLKRPLVESFVGAIALGYLLSQTILYFVGIFSVPLSGWISRREFPELASHSTAQSGFPFREAAPQLVSFVLLSGIWYILLRWLYFSPLKKETSDPPVNQERGS
ncbi:MAG TPA: hypothetical protein VKT53_13250 [Candidatus Acidoferrum sp.]|nr:hypothetical protein [Candidatus Acidoferrum sp.]